MHDREVHTHTVETDSGGGVASGMMLGIVLVLLALAVAAFLFFGNAFNFGGGPNTGPSTPKGDTNIQVNPPAPKVDVNVNPAPSGGYEQAPAQPGTTKP
jgi:hypothetical protein